MMSEMKDFGSNFVAEREAIKFKIHDEEFECVNAIQGKILLDMVSDSTSENSSTQAKAITKFFGYILTEESLERFNSLIESKDRIVPVETLGEIVGWVTEQLTERPNQQPEA
jgi:hypothetical protein